jgi:hypothetical protein
MSILTSIEIRKISNGFVVSGRPSEYYLGNDPTGGEERYYPTLDALVADAGAIVADSVHSAEASVEEHRRRLADEERQMKAAREASLGQGSGDAVLSRYA